MNLNKWLVEHKNMQQQHFPMVPRITCADGYNLSVQCNSGAYCAPREDRADVYSHVEIGFPSDTPTDTIVMYAEDILNPTGTVYGYVPIELVEELIELHGGIQDD